MERKALFTASTYSHIAHFHRPYLRTLSNQGWTVDVACAGARLDIPEARRIIHLPFEKSMSSPANFRAAAMLRREMKAEGYALVSTHTSLAAFFTRLAAQGLDTVVVNTCHGYLFDENTPLLKRGVLLEAEKRTAGRTDLLLTMNRQDEEIARRHRLGRRMAAIPGVGVNFSRLDAVSQEAGEALRLEWGIPQTAFVLLYPAEFSKRKSQKTLLRAMALLPEKAFLLLPGSGGLLEECKALAGELGVADRVRFPGHVGDMGPWYRAANCAVASSRSEGLPFNMMEAMYRSLPVVASHVKGHEDLVREGETGFLFPWDNAELCAKQIRELMEDPFLAARLGQAGREEVKKYSLERVLPQVLEAYRTVVPELEVPVLAGIF